MLPRRPLQVTYAPFLFRLISGINAHERRRFCDLSTGGAKLVSSKIFSEVRVFIPDGFLRNLCDTGWSNEECPVYIPSVDKAMNDGETLAFTIERAALPLFGFPNFGTFLIGGL